MIAQPRDIPTRHDEAAARGRASHLRTNRGGYRRVRMSTCWSFLLILGLTSPAWAQGGINLSWDDCGTAGSSLKTFACDTNAGSNVLVASFTMPALLTFSAVLGVLDLQTSGAALPNWWQFKNPGTCRQTALSASANFTSGPYGCADPWLEEGTPGIAQYQVGLGGPNRARILAVVQTAGYCRTVVPADSERMAFKLILSNVKSVGTGSCDGCVDGACIVFNSLTVYQCGPWENVDLTTPLDRNFVTWQAGIPNCPGATPVQNRTWGAVKTLYR